MFTLPELHYQKTDLEPYMSHKTLTFHHEKHHQTYINDLNKLIQGTEFENMMLENIILKTADKPEYSAIFNNAAQTFNHTFFFEHLSSNGGQKPSADLLARLEKTFGSYEDFKQKFKSAALSQFGSGWVWLVEDRQKNLQILKTSNADTPIVYGLKPILTIDVWEHAYYLDYQNRRGDFIDAVLTHLINWKNQ